ncbi:MAG: type II secretion system protein GspG [Blastocatellia bacterium]|nr:type II secretion system protein GspG [Blastocatellia bacterium]
MSEITGRQCKQCGADLVPGRRHCIVCHKPVSDTAQLSEEVGQTRQTGQHGLSDQFTEILREIPSTQRPDKTLVFVPERREARLRRKRRNRRILIAALTVCIALIILSIAYWRTSEQRQVIARQQRREVMAKAELERFSHSLEIFYDDVGRYPTEKEGLSALLVRPAGLTNWHGPYIDGDYSLDPWGNDYVYKGQDDGLNYELFSYGPEGEESKTVFLRVNSKESK